MILRFARACAAVQAAVVTLVVIAAGMFLQQQTVGVTRQPLPLVWPLAVVHVCTAQIPLRDLLGPVELVAHRAPAARAVRTALVCVLLGVGGLTYVRGSGDPALAVLYALLVGLGFVAATTGRLDPWVWTLSVGTVVIGLAFTTPLGGVITAFLGEVPLAVAVAGAGAAGWFHVVHVRGLRRWPRRGALRSTRSSRAPSPAR